MASKLSSLTKTTFND